MKKDKMKSNITINFEDKYNLLKDGSDYEDYSKNYIEDKTNKNCQCCGNCCKKK